MQIFIGPGWLREVLGNENGTSTNKGFPFIYFKAENIPHNSGSPGPTISPLPLAEGFEFLVLRDRKSVV